MAHFLKQFDNFRPFEVQTGAGVDVARPDEERSRGERRRTDRAGTANASSLVFDSNGLDSVVSHINACFSKQSDKESMTYTKGSSQYSENIVVIMSTT